MHAVRNWCPHKARRSASVKPTGTMIPDRPARLQWGHEGEILRCPWHGFEFNIDTGASALYRQPDAPAVYPARVENGDIIVDMGPQRSRPERLACTNFRKQPHEHRDTCIRASRTDADADIKVIDCDVHPSLPGGLATLFPLMPKSWVERFKLKGGHLAVAAPLGFRFEHPVGSAARHDARTPNGGPPGSDPEYLRRDLLDTHGISTAVLTSLQAGQFGTVSSRAR